MSADISVNENVSGVHNMRPAGRMRPAESQDAARRILPECINFGPKVPFVHW